MFTSPQLAHVKCCIWWSYFQGGLLSTGLTPSNFQLSMNINYIYNYLIMISQKKTCGCVFSLLLELTRFLLKTSLIKFRQTRTCYTKGYFLFCFASVLFGFAALVSVNFQYPEVFSPAPLTVICQYLVPKNITIQYCNTKNSLVFRFFVFLIDSTNFKTHKLMKTSFKTCHSSFWTVHFCS